MAMDFNRLHMQNRLVQLMFALLLAAALVVVGYFAVFKDQWDELKAGEAKEEQHKAEFTTKAAKAANLENLKIELEQIEASITILLRQLPTSAEVPNLIQELHQAAAKNNLTLSSVTPKGTVPDGVIDRLPFAISLVGDHAQIARFARDVGRMSRIVTLANIELSSNAGRSTNTRGRSGTGAEDSGKLTFSALANTYKALDISEASAASEASAPGNQKNSGKNRK